MDPELRKKANVLEANKKNYIDRVNMIEHDFEVVYWEFDHAEQECYARKNEKCLNLIDNYWMTLKQYDREEFKDARIKKAQCDDKVPGHMTRLPSDTDGVIRSKNQYDIWSKHWECTAPFRENGEKFALRRLNFLKQVNSNLKQFIS